MARMGKEAWALPTAWEPLRTGFSAGPAVPGVIAHPLFGQFTDQRRRRLPRHHGREEVGNVPGG